jgi:hypothetical protein
VRSTRRAILNADQFNVRPLMKRIALSVLLALLIGALLMFASSGGFGPCGPTSIWGMLALLAVAPGAQLVDSLGLDGTLAISTIIAVPLLILTVVAWFCILGFEAIRRRLAASQAETNGPNQSTDPAP